MASAPRPVDERRTRWEFLTDDERRWFWRVADANRTRETKTRFATLKDCISDARTNGYVVWTQKDRRGAAH